MTSSLLLLMPRLHRELADAGPARALPPGALTLWPGLPRAPADAFVPDYPWSPEQARACLADFEQSGRAGAGGAPVLAFSVAGMLGAGNDVSPEERRALDELAGRRPDATTDAGERRAAFQRALLLAWLQERQVLELRALERQVREKRSALAGLLGEGGEADSPSAPVARADDAPLPAWRSVLAAAAPFLPDGAAVAATEQAMADAVQAAAGAAAPLPDGETPPGFAGAHLSLGAVLGRGWSLPEASRVLTFLYPSPRAAERPERA